MLEYKLPDLGKDNTMFRKMHPEDLYKMRNDIQSHLNLIIAASQEALDNNIESCCDICASYGYAYMDLPTGWGWLDEGTLICSKCINRWEERFGSKPHLNRELEIEYEQYGSLSEDSAHRDKQLSTLFEGEVEITEKVDGSQLGFGKVNGELFVRSKGKEQDLDNPDMMFEKAVEYIKSIEDRIPDNHTFYGEWLNKPKHNTLAYDRTPKNGIALFGVYDSVTREHFGMDVISDWAAKLDVETVPLLFRGEANASGVLEMVNEHVSFLGGQNIEGVVVKRYTPWMFMGQIPQTVMSGKYVTEAFKEVHIKNWKKENTGKGKLEVAVSQYKSEARWNKAVQHLRDDGNLTGTPKDIGGLIKEVREDIITEEKEHIKDQLWEIYKNDFLQSATNGLPQWYKESLVKGEINEQ